MLKIDMGFGGFSVDDLDTAKEFYTKKLGLKLKSDEMGLMLELPGGGMVFVYNKPNHQPATYTMLNFEVADIDAAVEELDKRGVKFERYDGMNQDDKGIARGIAAKMGPDIAWFRDPAGNILAVLHNG